MTIQAIYENVCDAVADCIINKNNLESECGGNVDIHDDLLKDVNEKIAILKEIRDKLEGIL